MNNSVDNPKSPASIDLNDTVQVLLTEAGAEWINEKNLAFVNKWFQRTGKVLDIKVVKAGEVHKDQLHGIMQIFEGYSWLGNYLPFTDMQKAM